MLKEWDTKADKYDTNGNTFNRMSKRIVCSYSSSWSSSNCVFECCHVQTD